MSIVEIFNENADDVDGNYAWERAVEGWDAMLPVTVNVDERTPAEIKQGKAPNLAVYEVKSASIMTRETDGESISILFVLYRMEYGPLRRDETPANGTKGFRSEVFTVRQRAVNDNIVMSTDSPEKYAHKFSLLEFLRKVQPVALRKPAVKRTHHVSEAVAPPCHTCAEVKDEDELEGDERVCKMRRLELQVESYYRRLVSLESCIWQVRDDLIDHRAVTKQFAQGLSQACRPFDRKRM